MANCPCRLGQVQQALQDKVSGEKKWKRTYNPIGSMGRLYIYIARFTIKIQLNVVKFKYNIHMDGMG